MAVTILYFAGLREALRCGEEQLENLPEGIADVAALREWLSERGGDWAALRVGQSLRAAVNQTVAHAHSAVVDGDEVAFFPPVTGG